MNWRRTAGRVTLPGISSVAGSNARGQFRRRVPSDRALMGFDRQLSKAGSFFLCGEPTAETARQAARPAAG